MKKIATIFTVMIAFLSMMVGNASAEQYEVKKGDTLWDISRNYDTSIDKLKVWNDIHSDLIYPNQVLAIMKQESYKIQKGDTLWDIAIDNHVTVGQLMEWNDLKSSRIYPNEKLVIISGNKKIVDKTVKTDPTPQEKKVSVTNVSTKSAVKTQGKEINMKATAYTASCAGCSGITATGVNLHKNPNAKVISVDPSVIPLGTKVYVEGYGYATAADTGGAIKGNKIDIFFSSLDKAKKWGVRTVKVKILE